MQGSNNDKHEWTLNQEQLLSLVMCFRLPFVQNFTKAGDRETARCDTQAQLIAKGCKKEEIISPQNHVVISKKEPLTSSFKEQGAVQLSPQKISLKLRPGKWNQLRCL